MELEFSEMTYEDLDEILAIERASFVSPWTRLMFISELERKNISYLYVARAKDTVDRTILGYITFWYLESEAQITNIATNPEHLRKGIGKRMLEFTLQKMQKMGVKEVFLEVRVTNIAAQNLYKKSGFEIYGIRKKYYAETGEDAILMRKTLTSL